MNRLNAEQIINKIVNKLIKEYHPEKIILFGSYAYGTPTEDSDIDLLIIKNTEDIEKKRRVDRCVEIWELIYDPDNKIPIQPLVFTDKELEKRLKMGDDFIEEILTKGKIIYERRNSQRVV